MANETTMKPALKKTVLADTMQAMGILPVLILIVIVFSFID